MPRRGGAERGLIGTRKGGDETRRDETYGAIGRTPHLLQLELLHARLVRRDGRALDADIVLEDRLGRLDRYLVVGLCGQMGGVGHRP